MGIFDRLKNELIDIIEWLDKSDDTLVERYLKADNEIKMGAKLIVRPGQKAVFVNEGEIADVFDTGTHTLETQNLPVLSKLKGWIHGFNSPFKAEVYFIDVTEQLDRKWGTQTPIMLRDQDFGIVRLRCRGNYSYQIAITDELITRFTGATKVLARSDFEGQFRTKIISSFSDAIAELKIPALDLAAQYNEISDEMKNKLTDFFNKHGLNILAFTVENITLPEEVQKSIDQRSSLGALGDLNKYTQFQAANALRDAANNEGMAGNMMGMMVGGQMAGNMGNVLYQPQNQGNTAQPQANLVACSKCNQQNQANAKFCASCGNKMGEESVNCIKCSKEISKGVKFCPECGSAQSQNCNKCNTPLASNSHFCSSCGAKQ